MSKYSELQQKRELARRQHQRRELWRALRRGKFDNSPITHTVTFHGDPVTVTEVEYLWLKLRGHIIENYAGHAVVTDTHHIALHSTTEFRHDAQRQPSAVG